MGVLLGATRCDRDSIVERVSVQGRAKQESVADTPGYFAGVLFRPRWLDQVAVGRL